MATMTDATLNDQLAALDGILEDRRRAWAQEESALLDQLAAYIAETLWSAQQGPSLLARIREATGGKMVRPGSNDTVTDWRDDVPAHYRRMTDGVPADMVAERLGFDGEAELLDAIREEVRRGRFHSRSEARQAAESEAVQHPEYLALVAAHAREAAEWEEQRAMLAALCAEEPAAPAGDGAGIPPVIEEPAWEPPVLYRRVEWHPIPSRSMRRTIRYRSAAPAPAPAASEERPVAERRPAPRRTMSRARRYRHAAPCWAVWIIWILLRGLGLYPAAGDDCRREHGRRARKTCPHCQWAAAERLGEEGYRALSDLYHGRILRRVHVGAGVWATGS